MKRCKKIFFIVSPVILIISLYIIGFAYIKLKKFFVLPCVFRMFTGFYCCGCGGTRSFFALLKGNILQSLRYNPIVLFGVIFFIFKWLEFITHKKIIPRNSFFWYAVSGIFIIFYIARNFIPILAPV